MVFGHFWQRSYENTKILRNLCLHFARQDVQDGKKSKENHATKVTKIPKTKRRKYGMNKTLESIYNIEVVCLMVSKIPNSLIPNFSVGENFGIGESKLNHDQFIYFYALCLK